MLQLKQIWKIYKTGDFEQEALVGINLNFRDQEFVAILGPSGSGKTTTLNIIGGLDSYDNGDLIINGKSTNDFTRHDWDAYRNHTIGFVFQSYNLINHLSVLNNVEIGLTLSGVGASRKRKKALKALERVGLKDHVHKKPTQLSGGQMQRVAIARALANDPDIILADEPTGALDTKTSVQIMELIKEIARDKLVIMVTHNPELALAYADRIVQFQDGRVIYDSNPFDIIFMIGNYALKQTSMNYITALKLSFRNIVTKIWRTALTMLAFSIGLIGVAIVLALSNGFNRELTIFEADALMDIPISIWQEAWDWDQVGLFGFQDEEVELEIRPAENVVYVTRPEEGSIVHHNRITDELLEHLELLDPYDVNSILYSYLVNLNLLRQVDDEIINVNIEASSTTMASTMAVSFPTLSRPFGKSSKSPLFRTHELLAGAYPAEVTDLVLIVDEFNRVNASVLEGLGIDTDGLERMRFEDFVGMELRLIPNNDFYIQTGHGNFIMNSDLEAVYNSEDATTLTIRGVFRQYDNVSMPLFLPGILSSDFLHREVVAREVYSDIVEVQREANYNVLTLETINEYERTQMLDFLGGRTQPVAVHILPYPTLEAKDAITSHIEAFNEGVIDDDYRILYEDQGAALSSMMDDLLTTITLVLVSLSTVSLVVSLVMIAIITYISVIERTKEIGILRALGARKKDITRIFIAEVIIIGFLAGIFSLGVTFLVSPPLSDIIYELIDMVNVCDLTRTHVIIIIQLSLILPIAAGFIPARIAAKKDPVEALRTE